MVSCRAACMQMQSIQSNSKQSKYFLSSLLDSVIVSRHEYAKLGLSQHYIGDYRQFVNQFQQTVRVVTVFNQVWRNYTVHNYANSAATEMLLHALLLVTVTCEFT